MQRLLLRVLQRPASVGLLIAILVFAVLMTVRNLGGLMNLELGAYDRFLSMRPDEALGDSRVVLVSIGEADMERFGFPLSHQSVARALANLVELGPRAIGVDIYRSSPAEGDSAAHEGWEALARTVVRHPEIVMIRKLGVDPNEGFPAPAFIEDDAQVGFNDVVVDPSNYVRRAYLIDWDEQDQPSLAVSLRVALLYLADRGIGMESDSREPGWIRLGDTPIPPVEPNDGGYRGVDAGGYQLLLDYLRPDDEFPTLSFSQAVNGEIPPELVRDKVVLIGTRSATVKDDFRSPVDASRVIKGVTIHAHTVDQLLRMGLAESWPIAAMSERAEALWTAAMCLLGASAALWRRNVASTLLASLAASAAICAAGYGLLMRGLWVPVIPPLFGWLASSSLVIAYVSQRERSEKREVMSFFRRFTSRRVADELWRRRDEFMDGARPRPQRLVITAALSDLKGYTEASEKLDPEDLMSWINTYMDAMTRVIEAHGGHVDDYAGDGIKFNFGVPLPSIREKEIDADAVRAVECALAMGDELEALNRIWVEQGLPTGRQRIGIATGPAVVGSLGSDERLKYTSIGDTVNTSARLEGLSLEGQDFDREDALFRILVTDATVRRLGDRFVTECIGDFRLKGKGKMVRIHRIFGRAPLEPDQGERI